MTKNKNSGGTFLAAALLGGALGTVFGILIAPKTGRETRRLVKKSVEALPELAEDVADSVQFQAHRLSDSARRNWDSTLLRLKEAIAAGVEASQEEADQLQRREEISMESNSVNNRQ